ncbi:nitrate/nitrite transporter [Bacillus sp. FJAT-27225]|uniref:NarK/NasA family nitrate transporter n=1 Tax=Bacillus sp. FJAT-27225 TaxID=1743144 RepID=UPI00080C3274|nr:NarK/NasA family nitrate transporter [Bacillus sp. FJAT-27225]OCA90767.1 nitrate/nitrite transporter [Bacillus sp. FJAT-27225]
MKQGTKQLLLQTASLIAGFMVWVIISSLMPFIVVDLHITSVQTAWAIAIPVFLGSIFRVPAGYLTGRLGARILFSVSFIILTIPILLIQNSESVVSLLAAGIFLGFGGAVFSVGTTSLPKYFPKSNHGFINGIYGIGTIGTALTAFFAPLLANQIGWRDTVEAYLYLAILFALVNFLFGDRQEKTEAEPLKGQFFEVYKNKKLWLLCFFYFITFGVFLAFTMYLPIFMVKNFSLLEIDAGFRTALFIFTSIVSRVAGGWLADKLNPLYILMVSFIGLSSAGMILSFTPSLPIFSFVCLMVAICSGLGNGAIFKLVPLYFYKHAGIVNGLVTAMGGLGGFFPPIILGAMYSLTGYYAIGFMALSELALAALLFVLWMFYHERQSIFDEIFALSQDGITVTDPQGIIQNINPAFTRITGYTLEEVRGKTPSVLQSGEHDNEFYRKMWENLLSHGHWEGYIWNRRKNGDIYQEYLTIHSIKDETGETKNYVAMFREINT